MFIVFTQCKEWKVEKNKQNFGRHAKVSPLQNERMASKQREMRKRKQKKRENAFPLNNCESGPEKCRPTVLET